MSATTRSPPGSTNWGKNDTKNGYTLGFSRSVSTPSPKTRRSDAHLTQRGARQAHDRGHEHGPELAWSMVLDSLVLAAEAEIRWLDHCESRLRRAAAAKS